jgi:type II secretory pathway pseudopilin PulG
MPSRKKTPLIENIVVLALMGILAGAIGGLAVGVVTTPKASTSTTTPTH